MHIQIKNKRDLAFSYQGEQVGQQFPTDTGPLHILAISKDNKTLLVVELKKGRACDAIVGRDTALYGVYTG